MIFKDKKILLTGATGGIGKAILEEFLKHDALIAASGSNVEKLNNLCINKSNVISIPCDLNDLSSVANLVTEAEKKLDGIDILVCNAGITKDNLSIVMKLNDWNEVININLTSTFLLNQMVSKIMLKKKFGRIINITSIVGVTGNAGQANYAASKAGIIGFTKSMASEFATKNITFNCIAPGFIESPMTDKLTASQKEQIIQSIPMRRMGTAQEVAHGVLFLASENSSYITGHTLHINGGMLKF